MYKMTTNCLWDEYKDYVEKYPLTGYERRRLRAWVKGGHSVYETVESSYLPGPAYPPMDFIDAYRLDRELREAMKGMKRNEREQYLKDYIGYEDEPDQVAETPDEKLRRATKHIHRLEHELFYLWEYLSQEGLWSEAKAYLEESEDEEIPFGWE